MKRFLSVFKLLLGFPLSAIAIFFIFKAVFSQKEIFSINLAQINYFYLFISFFAFLIYFLLRTFLWKLIIKYFGHNLPLKDVAYDWSISEIKRFIPGKIWAFLGRTIIFAEKGVGKKTLVSAILIEAEFLVVSSFALSILAIPFILNIVFPINHQKEAIFIIFMLIFLLIFLFVFNKVWVKYVEKLIKIPFLKYILPHFTIKENLSLFCVSLLFMFFYSVGTYFSVLSLTSLNIRLLMPLIGFFSFSYLIGFISLVTPMGLGVREGIITIGLSKIVLVSLAGIASVFTRIILIISELLFLYLTYFWRKNESKVINLIKKIPRFYKIEVLLGLIILVYICYFTFASFLRYDNFYAGRFDLGNMDQTVWNTINGKIFQLTNPDGTEIISRLSVHADFILVLLSPFYLIWADPKMLLFLQTAILSTGAIFIYLISQKIIGKKYFSFILSFVFLLNPSLENTNLYDFHPVTLATTFLLAAFYFLIHKKYVKFSFFALLAALSKEEIWIIVSLFGIYIFLDSFINKKLARSSIIKQRIMGISFFIFSLSTAFFLVSYAIPKARGADHFALSYYADFGNSPLSVIKNIILSPFKTFSLISDPNRLLYIKQLFLPLGFLPLLSPYILIFALPDLLINLLSNNVNLHQIYYQYTAAITPFLFISTIYTVNFLKNTFTKVPLWFYAFFLLFLSIYSAYSFGPLPFSKSRNFDMFAKPQPYRDVIDDFLDRIPEEYSIAATNNIGSHLSHRQKIFTIPLGIDKADIVIFLLNDQSAQPSLAAQKEIAEKMKNDRKYIQVFKQNDFIVFEKRRLYLKIEPKISQVKLFPFSIATLAHRDYNSIEIEKEKIVKKTKLYLIYKIKYLSDGLSLHGELFIPNQKKPEKGFPVVVINQGLENSNNIYEAAGEYFASKGYLVLKPNYRGSVKSEFINTNFTHFMYPIDMLNLLFSLPSIKEVDKDSVFLWGHSLGGEVTLKTIEVFGDKKDMSVKIKAAVLLSPIIDPIRWYSQFENPVVSNTNSNRIFRILGEPSKNSSLWQSLSPLSYLNQIKTPLQINHGTSDSIIPYDWSIELYNDLISLGKTSKLIFYPQDNHLFSESFYKVLQNNLNFFQQYQ